MPINRKNKGNATPQSKVCFTFQKLTDLTLKKLSF